MVEEQENRKESMVRNQRQRRWEPQVVRSPLIW
jgi:hypothetical protein